MNTKNLREYAVEMAIEWGTFFSWFLPEKGIWVWECSSRVFEQDARADMSSCRRESYFDEESKGCARKYVKVNCE